MVSDEFPIKELTVGQFKELVNDVLSKHILFNTCTQIKPLENFSFKDYYIEYDVRDLK